MFAPSPSDIEQIKADVAAETIPLAHARFRFVWPAIFTRKLAADCMTHDCTQIDQATHIRRNDICCQYGVDTDLLERDAIHANADKIRPLLTAAAQVTPWFGDEIFDDKDYPSGHVVRTSVFNGGCVFLSHDGRGCAIHRASLEQGWDMNGIKPSICRLYPLSYEEDTIVIADEYPEYTCAHVGDDGISVYRAARPALLDAFGPELVAALDTAEVQVIGAQPPQPKRLPVV